MGVGMYKRSTKLVQMSNGMLLLHIPPERLVVSMLPIVVFESSIFSIIDAGHPGLARYSRHRMRGIKLEDICYSKIRTVERADTRRIIQLVQLSLYNNRPTNRFSYRLIGLAG